MGTRKKRRTVISDVRTAYGGILRFGCASALNDGGGKTQTPHPSLRDAFPLRGRQGETVISNVRTAYGGFFVATLL